MIPLFFQFSGQSQVRNEAVLVLKNMVHCVNYVLAVFSPQLPRYVCIRLLNGKKC